MKLIKYIFLLSLIIAFGVSCEKGLDPINAGDPGTEVDNPEVVITFPQDGKIVRSSDSVAEVTFKFLASDDFELKSVSVKLDDSEIGNITTFKDYRRLDANYMYSELRDGSHTLIVVVTDMSGKTASDTVNFLKITTAVYVPLDGEVLYLPFDGDYKDAISEKDLTVVGSPAFENEGKVNLAYAGAADSYLEFPTDGLLGEEFSVAFWYKLNPTPGRGGIISISRGDIADNRPWGFRLFREDAGANMKFGVNFGIGTTEVWMNPFLTMAPNDEWMHIAVTIGGGEAKIYVNGEVVLENLAVAGTLDWTNCTSLSIASGMPNFIYWDHLSDLSLYDEMHMFKRVLTAEEVQSFFDVK